MRSPDLIPCATAVVLAAFGLAGASGPGVPTPVQTAAASVVRVIASQGAGLFARRSSGSGVVIRSDGLVLTAAHVIPPGARLRVIPPAGAPLPARLIATDADNDLALLRVGPPQPLPALDLAAAAPAQRGDRVFVAGYPRGAAQAITVGQVADLPPTTGGIADLPGYIRTSAPVQPGDSGGALLGEDARLIGLVTGRYVRPAGAAAASFATPLPVARAFVARSLAAQASAGETAPAVRLTGVDPLAGAAVAALSPALARRWGIDPGLGGILVLDAGRGLADQSGFRAGDVVVEVNDARPGSPAELQTTLSAAQAWRIAIRRDGVARTGRFGAPAGRP